MDVPYERQLQVQLPEGAFRIKKGRLIEQANGGRVEVADDAGDGFRIVGEGAVVGFQQNLRAFQAGDEPLEALDKDGGGRFVGGVHTGAREDAYSPETVVGDSLANYFDRGIEGGGGCFGGIEIYVGTQDFRREIKRAECVSDFGRGGGIGEVGFKDFDAMEACGGYGWKDADEGSRGPLGGPSGGFECDSVKKGIQNALLIQQACLQAGGQGLGLGAGGLKLNVPATGGGFFKRLHGIHDVEGHLAIGPMDAAGISTADRVGHICNAGAATGD